MHTRARAPKLCTIPGRRGRVRVAEVVHRHLGRRPVHNKRRATDRLKYFVWNHCGCSILLEDTEMEHEVEQLLNKVFCLKYNKMMMSFICSSYMFFAETKFRSQAPYIPLGRYVP